MLIYAIKFWSYDISYLLDLLWITPTPLFKKLHICCWNTFAKALSSIGCLYKLAFLNCGFQVHLLNASFLGTYWNASGVVSWFEEWHRSKQWTWKTYVKCKDFGCLTWYILWCNDLVFSSLYLLSFSCYIIAWKTNMTTLRQEVLLNAS